LDGVASMGDELRHIRDRKYHGFGVDERVGLNLITLPQITINQHLHPPFRIINQSEQRDSAGGDPKELLQAGFGGQRQMPEPDLVFNIRKAYLFLLFHDKQDPAFTLLIAQKEILGSFGGMPRNQTARLFRSEYWRMLNALVWY